MQFEPAQHFLGAGQHALMLVLAGLGRGDRDQFDLGELVLADHAAGIAAAQRQPRRGSTASAPSCRSGSSFSSTMDSRTRLVSETSAVRDEAETLCLQSLRRVRRAIALTAQNWSSSKFRQAVPVPNIASLRTRAVD